MINRIIRMEKKKHGLIFSFTIMVSFQNWIR